MCADIGKICADNVRKCADIELSVMFKRAVSVRCVSVHVTETETLRGERM